MAARDDTDWVTAELSPETWPDFVDLFSRGNGWDFCACMYFKRGRGMPRGSGLRERAALQIENQRQKRELLDDGRAHGILVYSGEHAVGWCQFGPAEELPCGYIRGVGEHERAPEPDWRVTCFVTDKRYRGMGVAHRALEAAVEAIRQAGGGTVEAYPVAGWTRGPGATDPGDHIAVDGAGLVLPAWGTYGFVSTQGTLSMFRAQRFEATGVVQGSSRQKVSGRPPESHVIVRRRVD